MLVYFSKSLFSFVQLQFLTVKVGGGNALLRAPHSQSQSHFSPSVIKSEHVKSALNAIIARKAFFFFFFCYNNDGTANQKSCE